MAAIDTLLSAVRSVLAADTGAGGVNTLTGGRIYHAQAPKDAALPLLVYTVVSNVVVGEFTRDHFEVELQLDAYGYERLGASPVMAIVDRVTDILARVSLSASGWSTARVELTGRGVPSVEDEAYRVMQTYRIYAMSA